MLLWSLSQNPEVEGYSASMELEIAYTRVWAFNSGRLIWSCSLNALLSYFVFRRNNLVQWEINAILAHALLRRAL